MDEIDLAMMRHKLRNNEIVETNKKDSNKISKLFTKILLSIILVLGCTIYVKLSPDNMAWFKENIFEIELPQEFEKIAGIFNTLQIDLKYENMFFSTKLTNYNQLVLCYIGTEISSDDMICFNISVVK